MQSISGSKSMTVKTDWAADPMANEKAPPKQEKRLADKLNDMVGVQDQNDPYAQTKKKKLDKDAFLKMFMTQLKYQDPTSPVDNEKMAQQMAMFTQIEQSVTTNQYLEKMAARQDDRSQLAYSMIGKTIQADKASLFHDKLTQTQFNFDLPKDASTLKVEILDEAGELVTEIDMDSHTQGEVGVRWDGKTADGLDAMSGRYFYNVKATDTSGQPIVVDRKTEGRVTGITKSGGDTFLLVGDQKVSMNEVNTVMESPTVQNSESEASGSLQADGKPAGTKSESSPVAAKVESKDSSSAGQPELSISDDVARALKGDSLSEDLLQEGRLNPIMPLFMR